MGCRSPWRSRRARGNIQTHQKKIGSRNTCRPPPPKQCSRALRHTQPPSLHAFSVAVLRRPAALRRSQIHWNRPGTTGGADRRRHQQRARRRTRRRRTPVRRRRTTDDARATDRVLDRVALGRKPGLCTGPGPSNPIRRSRDTCCLLFLPSNASPRPTVHTPRRLY